MLCQFCKKDFKSIRSVRSHEGLCKQNNNRRKSFFEDISWQKTKKPNNQFIKAAELGLSLPKVSTETKLKISLSTKNRLPKTKEVLERLSILAKERNLGGVTQSRWIKYNGKTLGSNYELIVAKDLDKYNITWDTCKRIDYVDPFGKKRTYTPDFYLKDYNVYLDPKNDFLINHVNPSLGFKDTEKINLVEIQNNIRIIILNKHELSWDIILNKIITQK